MILKKSRILVWWYDDERHKGVCAIRSITTSSKKRTKRMGYNVNR